MGYVGDFVKLLNPLIKNVSKLNAATFAILAEHHRVGLEEFLHEIRDVVDESRPVFDSYFRHRFSLLGTVAEVSRSDSLCERCRATSNALGVDYSAIEWHRDFGSGELFDPYCRPASVLNAYRRNQVEVKWPWELSRLQHLPQFGAVWRVHEDQDYRASLIREFQLQVMDWVLSNPKGLGVNWSCLMDIGIRGANLALAYRLFSFDGAEKTAWGAFFRRLISQHLESCGPHLSESAGNNHAIAELASVYVMSILQPDASRASYWKELSKRFLVSQLKRQVDANGFHYERSVYYHLYILEMCLYAGLVGKSVGDLFSSDYLYQVERMYTALRDLVGVDGRLPMIGDRDEGYFFIPLGTRCDRFRLSHVLALCERFLGAEESMSAPEQLIRIMIPTTSAPTLRQKSRYRQSAFEDAGINVLCAGSWSVTSSVGPSGLESTGHEHLDRLSIVVSHLDGPVIIDPGTARYTSSLVARRLFRSLLSHNGPCYLEDASNEVPERPFGHFVHPKSGLELEYSVGTGARLSMWAEQGKRSVRREVWLREDLDFVEIKDVFVDEGQGRVALCLSPDMECFEIARNTYRLSALGRQLCIQTENFSFDRQVRPCSLRYGEETSTIWLVFEGLVSNDRPLVWRILQEQSL